jgi:hypothetical protein
LLTTAHHGLMLIADDQLYEILDADGRHITN